MAHSAKARDVSEPFYSYAAASAGNQAEHSHLSDTDSSQYRQSLFAARAEQN